MADQTNISTYTAYDIEKYHKGLLSAAEMNKLERAALEDPFLADALDGYAETPVNLTLDMADLTNRLQQKKDEKKIVPITGKSGAATTWWRIAALLVLVAGLGYGGYRFAFDNKEKELALEDTNGKVQPAPVAAPPVVNDSNTQSAGNLHSDTEKAAVVENKSVLKDEASVAREEKSVNSIAAAPAATADLAIKQDTASALNEVVITGYGKESKKSYNAGPPPVAELKNTNQAAPKQRSVAAKEEAEEALALQNNNQSARQRKAHGPDASNRANIYRGQIVDAQQNPVPFANITNPIDNVGTYSDVQGRFALLSTDSVLQVQVRSLGFKDKNIALQTNAATNQVVLVDDQSVSPVVLNQKRLNSNLSYRQNKIVFDEPEPEAGWYNYDSYLANNIRLPETDYLKSKKQAPNTVGEVQLSFEVSKQGRPINIKVEKSLCDACDKEAIRLLKEGPRWKRNKGKKHTTSITVSF
jgi:hypothetical protein